ncbi:MAG: hypothetical protein HY866_00295 [Chloroflexi bacterium]|nr:hypothetical protein [Chloroflexota bacterium]
MSKRNMVLMALVLVFAFSVTALAMMPNSTAAQTVQGTHQLGVIKSFEFKPVLNPPDCPFPIPPGC